MRSVISTLLHILFTLYTAAAPTEIYTLSLHDALPISGHPVRAARAGLGRGRRRGQHHRRRAADRRPGHLRQGPEGPQVRSEEHTSELQSQSNLVCRLLLEKKKRIQDRRLKKESKTSLT